ncbi:Predicted membrane protein [Chitinophaga jiangningensis]|uniref:Predicted membrane protein n=1 Tax=Chitinophaga jiangningensis TaxID=1419482 RepID=A0A1M6VH40_9BACT|nr:DUF5668 domain-containing protein [Chitinophaga jiangningensis]SHK80833.1 Predicted membrane protein [Chitinophaga jiangningensis]
MSSTETEIKKSKRGGNAVGGIVLILIGVGLLLKRLDLDLPYWLFSWQMLLIVIGLLVGIKHEFRGGGWLAMLMVGGVFLAGEIMQWPYNTARFIWPVVLIGVGIVIMLKRNEDWSNSCKHKWHRNRDYGKWKHDETHGWIENENYNAENYSDDRINATAIFGSVNKLVLSKDFKGGYVSAIFGGGELNFTQADIKDTAVLDVTAIFGGCEIIVPSNWNVIIDVTTILGGVDDKRNPELMRATTAEKTLVLKGSCIFGGVEIKSYI